jgi:hypothetical protein
MRALALALVIACSPQIAAAQAIDLTTPDPIADELADVRNSQHIERREAGIVLLVDGLVSVIGGGILAAVAHDDPFWLAFGLGSAAWGTVNASLSIGMLDIGDGGFRTIEEDRALRGRELREARERALRAQHSTATMFAFNLGLDVFYVATGILLFFLADQIGNQHDRDLLRGYSSAMTAQGGLLFAFDLVEWLASVARADRIARIEAP